MDRGYIAENDAERERLRRLVERLTDKELQRAMPAGWTVAAVLAHVAFWDARTRFLIDKWQRGTAPSAEDLEPAYVVDWVNDSAKPLCLALQPRTAAKLALAIAGDVDRLVATMSDDLIAKNTQVGGAINLYRAEHRREHLDEIERSLAG